MHHMGKNATKVHVYVVLAFWTGTSLQSFYMHTEWNDYHYMRTLNVFIVFCMGESKGSTVRM